MFLPKLSLIINFKSKGKSFFASSNLFLDDHCSTSNTEVSVLHAAYVNSKRFLVGFVKSLNPGVVS